MPIISLTPKERSSLRSEAHNLKPVVLIGAEGLTQTVLKEIDTHLAAHQLIKIRVFSDERDTRLEMYQSICEQLNAAPIQHIGKLLIIWRSQEAARVFENETAPEISRKPKKSAAPRTVRVVKFNSRNPTKRSKPTIVRVLGNERVTAGGSVKPQKKRQVSKKRNHQEK